MVLFVVLFATFSHIQLRQKELAALPHRIFKQRSIEFGVAFAFCIGSALAIIDSM